MIRIGAKTVQVVSGGKLSADGGNVFGVVPKTLWSRLYTPDENNRIRQETNCVLVQTSDYKVLIDTGYGSKSSAKQKANFCLQDGLPIVDNLKLLKVQPSDIDLVILSHLHFDHAGGSTCFADDHRLVPTFPNARYLVQRSEWEDANAQLPELAGAYFLDDFAPLAEAGQLHLLEGDSEVGPGLSVRLTGGHTRGHQAIYIKDGDDCVVCPADICPTAHHVRRLWTMAYDQFLLATRVAKYRLLQEAADKSWWVVFPHDPETLAARLKPNEKTTFELTDKIELE
jgi:glyoxylase-like metal-dependent hydrolase (beta-lactamase superfamily II)